MSDPDREPPARLCCYECRWWDEWPSRHSVDTRGWCRRLPPTLPRHQTADPSGDADFHYWPETEDSDWCGEFSALTLSLSKGEPTPGEPEARGPKSEPEARGPGDAA